MRSLPFVILGALQIATALQAVGHYTVIAPGTIHANHKYTVAVGVHDVNDICQMKVGINGADDYENFQTVELKSNEFKTLDFVVPALETEKSYNLTVEGLTGFIFKNTTQLFYGEFHPYVKIQTDKGKYKPGDKVQFRILFLDENLKPAKINDEVYAWIEDPKRNRIKEYKNLELVQGVYTDEFDVSEYALLGTWHIIVKNGEQYYNPQVTFSVEKYVLPKYTVAAEATNRVSVRDGDMQVVVRANYTYGKPVEAKVTLVMEMSNDFAYWNKPEVERKPAPITIRTADMVNGKAKFDLNIKDYAEYMPKNDTSYHTRIRATVEEQFTGVMLNGTTHSTFYPYRYMVSCENYHVCSTFKAGEEAELPIKILYVDNSKVEDTKAAVILRFKEVLSRNDWYFSRPGNTVEDVKPTSAEKSFVFESHLNGSSIANFKIKLDDLPEYEGYSHYYSIKAEFVDETHDLWSTRQWREPKEPQIVHTYKEPTEWFKTHIFYTTEMSYHTKIGEAVEVELNSSTPFSSFTYLIIGRGNVLHTERVVLKEPTKLYNLTIVPTFMMSPYCNIYVHFIDEHGEFHYTESSLSVEVKLQNTIVLTTPEEVKPGEMTTIKIKTPPHSFVGLLAVDQSALLLGQNNDLNGNDFHWRLGSYSTRTPQQGGYSYYPGEISGVVTLTNADYFYNRTKPEFALHPHYESAFVSQQKTELMTAAMPSGMAGPPQAIGESGIGGSSYGGSSMMESPRVRKDFAETWLFTNIKDTQNEEEFEWTASIPDTITSWVVSAFSLNNEKGLGITEEKNKIRTFQPFFISLRLPYAVKRGEVINVPALVFNYLEKELDVEITLENTYNEYEFVEASNEVIDELKRTKTVRVPANSARGVSFMLRPTTIGNVMLKFTAVSSVAGDAIHKILKVVPEGITKYGNRAYFINQKNGKETVGEFDLELPKDVVPDSQHIEFGVVGDLLGPVLNNLESMLRMPLGCGEQVTSTLIPNHLIMGYLKRNNKLNDILKRKIIRHMERGYQSILRYRNDDGSFGFFYWLRYMNDNKRTHSVWLTSYVVRALHQIAPYIKIDSDHIFKGWNFIANHQAENGSFVEVGDAYFGTTNHYLRLTAEVVLTFMEHPLAKTAHGDKIEKGLNYLVANIDKAESLSEKVFLIYVLWRAQLYVAVEHIKTFKALAKTDDDRMWWTDREESNKHWWTWSPSYDVETTSYILMMLLGEYNEIQAVLPIVRWLLTQRNSIGGFHSTRDTVVGIQALMKFAEKSGYEPGFMDIDFMAKTNGNQYTIKTTEDNALLLQTVELPQKSTGVSFNAKGNGSALVQVAYQYNIVETEKKPSFSIETIINKETPAHKLELDVCVEYTGEGAGSNMAIVEVSLPSGYVADTELFEDIEKIKGVSLTETKNKESVIVVYFDSLHVKEHKCLPIVAYRQFPVALQKPVPVTVFDYYDTSRRATNFYEVKSKLCDICDGDEDCNKICH